MAARSPSSVELRGNGGAHLGHAGPRSRHRRYFPSDPRLFERFASFPRPDGRKGTGLGLVLVKNWHGCTRAPSPWRPATGVAPPPAWCCRQSPPTCPDSGGPRAACACPRHRRDTRLTSDLDIPAAGGAAMVLSCARGLEVQLALLAVLVLACDRLLYGAAPGLGFGAPARRTAGRCWHPHAAPLRRRVPQGPADRADGRRGWSGRGARGRFHPRRPLVPARLWPCSACWCAPAVSSRLATSCSRSACMRSAR